MMLHGSLDRRKLIGKLSVSHFTARLTYVENFVVRAHGVVRTPIVTVYNHLEFREFLLALMLPSFFLFHKLSLLCLLDILVVVGRLTSTRQVMRCYIGAAADFDVTRIITISPRVRAQVIIQI